MARLGLVSHSEGGVFRSVGYPNIDLNNGATPKGMLDAVQMLANTAGSNTKVVPGSRINSGRQNAPIAS